MVVRGGVWLLALGGAFSTLGCGSDSAGKKGSPSGAGGTTVTGSGGTNARGGATATGGATASTGGKAGGGGAGGAAGGRNAGAGGGNGGLPGSGGVGDAGVGDGGECEDALGVPQIAWGLNGGLVRFADTSFLDASRHYRRERDDFGNAAPITCSTTVGGCPSRVIEGIASLLADPTVQAALAAHRLFGVDSRPVDGAVFRVTVGANYLEVGSPCGTPPSGCAAIPPVVQGLVDRLKALDEQELAKKACTDVLDPAP